MNIEVLDNTYVLVYNLPYKEGIALTNKDLSDMINQFLKDHGINKSFIARKMSVTRQQIDNLFNKKNFSIDDANKILNTIGFEVNSISIKQIEKSQ